MANPHTTFAGSIPEYYDQYLGPAQFGPFGRALAATLPADPGGDVLEIACGTGLVTEALRERLHPSRRLFATDLSKPMVDYARAKLAAMPGIEWGEADAMSLPFPDGRFAAVVCALGLMFVPDKPLAMREMRRVLAPGGRICLSVWDRFEENPLAVAFAVAIESSLPEDSEVRFRLPWSMHDQPMLRALIAGAGFEAVRIDTRRLDITGDPRRIATGQVRGTPRGALLEKLGMTLDQAVEIAAGALQKLGGPDGVRSYGQALFITAKAATRP